MLQTVGRWLEEAYQNRIGFQRRKYHRLKSLREEKQKVSYFVHYFYIINYLHGWNKEINEFYSWIIYFQICKCKIYIQETILLI